MKTCCFLNNKGGVGKTASVTSIGHILSTQYKKKVLLVDIDPQHNTSARFSEHKWMELFWAILNNENLDSEVKTIEDLLINSTLDPHEAIQKTAYENLDLIPAYLTLSSCEEALKADVSTPQQFRLLNQLSKLNDEYDICLIDCSPSVNILNINALVASDEVYIPVRTDGDSCIGLAMSINVIKQVQTYKPSLSVGGIILTQCVWQEGATKTTYEFLKQAFNDLLIPIQIGVSKNLKENSFIQKPLLEVDASKNKSAVTKAYLLLSEYIAAPNKQEFLQKNLKRIMKLKHIEE